MKKYQLCFYKPCPWRTGLFELCVDRSYCHINSHLIKRANELLRLTARKPVYVKSLDGQYFDFEVYNTFGVVDTYTIDEVAFYKPFFNGKLGNIVPCTL